MNLHRYNNPKNTKNLSRTKHIVSAVTNREKVSVFQSSESKYITMYEIESSLDIVKGMRLNDRRDYFESILLDYDNVDKYYNIVKKLNSNYYKNESVQIHFYIFTSIIRLFIYMFNAKYKRN